jgi:S1-C subfamily serine protease
VSIIGLAVLTLASLRQEESTLQKLEKEISAVIEKVRPSVVRIHADNLTFSGVIYSKDGHVVTDASGLEHAAEIKISVGDKAYPAERMDADKRTGVAVLKIAAHGLRPALIAAEPCRTGAVALVVGNAFGMPESSSQGTIGGLGRSILVRGQKYENMLQVSATHVLPGDCGAFVSDSAGHLVGLIHSVTVESGDGKPVPSLAFAVPAAWVKFSADRIIQHGRMVRGWLGASLLPLDDAARAQLGLDAGTGAEVSRVERDSPAAKAGLATRDILVSYGGEAIRDLDALQWKVARVESPTSVKIRVLRNRESRDVDVQIEIDPQK